MGHISKAIAAGGLVWSEAPQKAMEILVWLISLIPWWPLVPMNVQDAILWFVAGVVAAGFGWIVYRIPNGPAPTSKTAGAAVDDLTLVRAWLGRPVVPPWGGGIVAHDVRSVIRENARPPRSEQVRVSRSLDSGKP
jgi:hypothetical protein